MKDDVYEVQQVVLRHHQAVADQDIETILDYRAETTVKLERVEGDIHDPTTWRAGGYGTREDARTFFTNKFDLQVENFI